MNAEVKMEGGCQCGAIRYCVTSAPFAAEYCHCRMCQKSVGAVVVNWMDFYTEQLTWTAGRRLEYESSESARRGFCAECGSSLSFRDIRHPEYLSLTIASLDDPNMVKPTRHIYADSQVRWLPIDDDCKRYSQGLTKPAG